MILSAIKGPRQHTWDRRAQWALDSLVVPQSIPCHQLTQKKQAGKCPSKCLGIALGFTAQKPIELSLCTENGSFSALEHCAAVSICLIYWYTYSIPCWTLHPRNSGGPPHSFALSTMDQPPKRPAAYRKIYQWYQYLKFSRAGTTIRTGFLSEIQKKDSPALTNGETKTKTRKRRTMENSSKKTLKLSGFSHLFPVSHGSFPVISIFIGTARLGSSKVSVSRRHRPCSSSLAAEKRSSSR